MKYTLHLYDDKRYELIAYTIIPNHTHIVFKPIVKRASARYVEDSALQKSDMNVALHDKPISDIMRLIKGKSAFEANKILNRTGKF